MPDLARPAGSIRYHVTGSGKPAILLSHGFGETSAMFDRNLAVAGARHQVVTWDIRGHGGSASPAAADAYSAAAALDDMAALIAELNLGRLILGGHSLGGYLSLDYAVRHPGAVAALVLIGTGPGFRRDEPRAEWNERAVRTAERLEQRGLDALGGSDELHGGQHEDVAGLAMAARYTLTQQDAHVIEALGSINVPALVIVGADDAPFQASADYLTAKLPQARKVVIKAAGHAPNVDQPDQFNAELRGFLDEIPSEGSPS